MVGANRWQAERTPRLRMSRTAKRSALRLVPGSPLCRDATIALFLSGLGFSAAAPQSRRSSSPSWAAR
jgi:SET family sugar efflux transporter-like MFS transporter